jgi:YVTN family beta-propeller protein
MGSSSISVRGLAAIVAVCALACVGAAGASAAPLVWISNTAKESVSTIDSGTGQLVGSPIAVGGEQPTSIAITPNGRRAIVINHTGSSVTVIETATRKPVKTIPLGSNGEQVAISPDGKTAYITDESDEEVHVLNPETAAETGSFEVGGEVEQVAFSPDGAHAYAGILPEAIAVVNTKTEEVVGKPIPVGGFAGSIVFTPDGETAYATLGGDKGVVVIDTALAAVVKTIPTPEVPRSLAVSPDGKRLYIAQPTTKSILVAETSTNTIVGAPITVPGGANEIAIAPDGKTAWVGSTEEVTPINLVTGRAETATLTAGAGVADLVVAPDQSPTAAFAVPSLIAGVPATFSGAASTDPDGTVASWRWTFGDGGTASGVGPSHTYRGPGTYNAKLSVVDDEGCGDEEVFTGRTAYCSGNPGAGVTHAVTVQPPPLPPTVTPSNKFSFGRLVHNRHNGTVRMQVKLPGAGSVFLFGQKVHAVSRKSKARQSMWLTIHARVELNKRLKKILRAPVRIRVTFTPNGGAPKTMHRSVVLMRAPHHRHAR